MPPPLPALAPLAAATDPPKARLNYLLQPHAPASAAALASAPTTPASRLQALSLVDAVSSPPSPPRAPATRLPSLAAAYPLPPLHPSAQQRARSADSAVVAPPLHHHHHHHHHAGAALQHAASAPLGGAPGKPPAPRLPHFSHARAGTSPPAFGGSSAAPHAHAYHHLQQQPPPPPQQQQLLHQAPQPHLTPHAHAAMDAPHAAQHPLCADSMAGVVHARLGDAGVSPPRRPPTADSGFSDVTVAPGGGMCLTGGVGGGSISSGPSLSFSSGRAMHLGATFQGRALRRPHFASGGTASQSTSQSTLLQGGKSDAELRDKREMRRMKNRISAARSRQRKTDTFETLQRELVEAKAVIEALTRQLDRANGGGRDEAGLGAGDALGPPPPPTVIAVPQDLRPVLGRDFVSADGLMDLLRGYMRHTGPG